MSQPESAATSSAPDCLAGGGEMGALMRSMDWSKTPLGAVECWSPALRMMVRLLLANRFPLLLWWGPRYCQLYNDPYRPVLGDKHPAAMGQPAKECFPEIWAIIGPLIDTPFCGGPATWMDDLQLEYIRYDRLEEAHFTVAYSPVPDDTLPSGIGGVLATVHEITEQIVGERRVAALRDLGARSAEAKTAEEACTIAAETLSQQSNDVPFALLYLMDGDRKHARLAGTAGIAKGQPESQTEIDVDVDAEISREQPWPLAEAFRTEEMQMVEDLQGKLANVPPGPWSDRPRSAVVFPIPSNIAHQVAGLLVLGISSRLRFDDHYRDFFELVRSQVATAIANARAYEEERKRAEALAEVDRAKTAFFSNVSHEFRTPLTLMLGPLEDMLASADFSFGRSAEELKLVHRNAQRLLKLVNTLLDFSRIEAGRTHASYQPMDLAAFTAELASVFRSAIESAGLRLSVDCPTLDEPVYLDPQMWEKIVLNLLSNAFKFTFEGEIAVSLRQAGEFAELSVRDTGTGIPENALPHLFDSFYRVEGAQGRTFEGSGIGLSLVKQLVDLHGGSVRAESVYGRGSCFIVFIPLGRAHLPAEHLGKTPAQPSVTTVAQVYVEATLQWLRTAEERERSGEWEKDELVSLSPTLRVSHSRILVADDNADMRLYLHRLLSKSYEVRAVSDGQAALEAAREDPPDLVLADIMMPRLDGFDLLHALRADPLTCTIPVILLSARAGEESSLEGLQAGADDYLIKPFSARELLARVGARLEIARLNRESIDMEHSLRIAADDAKAELARKNHELRRARNALQRELASRTEDLAQLAQELIDSRKNLISTKDELAAELAAMNRLHELSTALLGQTELQPLLEEVITATIALQNADMGCVQLYNPSTQALEIVAHRGFRQDFLDYFRSVHDDRTICGRAMLRRERVIVDDVLNDPGFAPHRAMAVSAGYRSVQSTPLFSRSGEPLGMISTYFRHPQRPSERELRLTDLYARQAAEMIERKRAEEELSRANAKITEILESITDGFSAWDQNWRYIYANERAAQLLGKSREQLNGRSVWELFPEAVGTEAYHKCQQAMAERLPVHFEACFYNRWYENYVYPTKEGLSVYWREITDRKRADEALRESNKRNQSILESITDEFNAFDRQWRFTYVNQAALNSIRRAKGEELKLEAVLGKNVWEMFPAHVGSPVYQKYQEAMREQKTVPFEAWSPVSGRWLEGRAYPSDEGLSVYYRDITERKRTEEQLRYHAYLLENVHDAVIATDERLAVTAWNKAAEQMYGWRADEVLGHHIWEVVPVELSDDECAEALRELEEKGRFRAEAVTYRKDGTPVYVEGITIALRQEQQGQITGYVNIRRDITERKLAENAWRQSEERSRRYFDLGLIGMASTSPEKRFLEVNNELCRLLGYDRDELLQKTWAEITHPDDLAAEVTQFDRVMSGEIDGYALDKRWICRDGSSLYTIMSRQCMRRADGSVDYFVGMVQDITERKRAEDNLRRSEFYLAEAQGLSHTGSWSWNVSTGELFWSAEHFRILGLHPEKTPPPYPAALEYIHPEDRLFAQKTLEDAMRTGSDFHVNCRIVRPDDTIRHIESFARPVFDDAGEVTEYIGTMIDITEREQSEQTLQENRQRLRVALESSPVAFTILRAARDQSSEIIDFEWLYLNPVASRILGHGAEALIGRRVRQVFPDGWEPPGLFDCFVQVVNTGEPREIEVRSRRNGVDTWFQNIAAKLGDGVAVWFADITARKRSEEALRRSEAFLAEGQKISHTGSWAVSFPSLDVFWSREMFSIYGLDPANTKITAESALLLIHPEDQQFVKETFERAVRDKSDYAIEHRAIMADGTLKHLYALGHPIINESGGLVEYVGTVVDISERKRAEESLRTAYAELAHATRVTMMGELAASIAHEINQPLGAITNNGNAGLHLAAAMPGSAHELREVLAEIVNDADRASAIIRRIRALVQRSATEGSWLQVGDVIPEALALAHRELIDHRITVRIEFSDDLPRIWSDRIQLQQVFLNLILNAVDAMSAVEDNRRVLNIRAEGDSLENKPAVLVSMEDRGDGFTPEDGERLFDAFFTTKQHGMGMGLRISRSIVEAYGGLLWASGNEDHGATFRLIFPAED